MRFCYLVRKSYLRARNQVHRCMRPRYRRPTDWFKLLFCERVSCARSTGFSLNYCIINFVLLYCVHIINLTAILVFFIDVFFDGVHQVAFVGYEQNFHYMMCPMEWWSKCMTNFDLLLLHLKSR